MEQAMSIVPEEQKMSIVPEEVVYLVLLSGLNNAPPPTVAVFTSLQAANAFCEGKNQKIPEKNPCRLTVKVMMVGTPSNQDFFLRINPPRDEAEKKRVEDLRGPDMIVNQEMSWFRGNQTPAPYYAKRQRLLPIKD